MKNYFLGIFPDQKTNYEIRKAVGDVGRIFQGQGIKVRWSKPENYHLTLIYLGKSLNILKKYLIIIGLNKINISPFKLTFAGASVGISRKYKELIYLTFSQGGDHLRDLVFSLKNDLKLEDNSQFIPHLSLGRISKELSDQEYTNLISDIRRTNKKLDIKGVSFIPLEIALVESDMETYKVLRKFPINPSA